MIVRRSDRTPFDFDGLQIRELTPEGLQEASVAEVEVAPGVSHKLARSTKSDKLYVCIAGSVTFWEGDKKLQLGVGDLVLIRTGEWFKYENETEEVARLILVHIPPFDLQCEEFRDARATRIARRKMRS